MLLRTTLIYLILLIIGCVKTEVYPPASQCPEQASSVVCQEFNISEIDKVVLRAEMANEIAIKYQDGQPLKICGTPAGGVEGYHSPDLDWKETCAEEWGLDFKAKKYDKTLVISTFNELMHIHHYYYLENIIIIAPEKIKIEKLKRILNSDGEADLSKP
jgi:hypothetical protein